MKDARRSWWGFAAGATALIAAMGFVTALVLDLESERIRARNDADRQTTLRLALWRMDSWLAPQIAREAVRPYFEYQTHYAEQKAEQCELSEPAPGDVLAPSPLTALRSGVFQLYFEIDDTGAVSSPQVPANAPSDLRPALDALAAARPAAEIASLWTTVAETLPLQACTALAPTLDFANRAQLSNMAQTANGSGPWRNAEPAQVRVDPMLPLWLTPPTANQPQLLLVRRVVVRERTRYQGVLIDWQRLCGQLLTQVSDLVDTSRAVITPITTPTAEDGMRLATVPAALTVAPAAIPPTRWTEARTALVGAWLATALALLAVGTTLRSTMALAERRARFAAAVTHELRTPLTTLRMYSQMLADGMVVNSERDSYLRTIETEADRLGRLVENVLGHARLDNGHARGARSPITVGDLLAQAKPTLTARAQKAGMELRVEGAMTARADTNAAAVAHILFNLVDNACKYAGAASLAVVAIQVTADARRVHIAVRDYGPGVPAAHAATVFRAFDRGAQRDGDNATPGLGLGLALARSLARDLGGDVALDSSVQPGARFVLSLPAARARSSSAST